MLLEDDDDLRCVMRDIFNMLGAAACLPLRSVDEMHEKADEVLEADLAILDVNLGPGVPNGIDAYKWLAASGFHGRIVFLTGHASSHPLVAAVAKLPEVTVLEKPLDIGDFAELLGTS